jgi:hypothetical protein
MSVSPLQLVPRGSSLLTQDLVIGFFSNSTSNTKYVRCYYSIVYDFTLFSFVVEGRVIICNISVVLRLKILIDIPCLAGSMVVARDVTIPLLPLYPTSR